MKYISSMMLFVIISISVGTRAQAAPPQWEIDTAHSRFGFEIRHIYASVYGYFENYTGDIRFDPSRPEQSGMNFVIDADSVRTFIGKRDNHLRSADFFDAEKYPKITFVGSSIKKISDERFDVVGTLTIKDVSKDIVLPFTFYGIVQHPADAKKLVAGFEARLPLNRLDYHVGNGKFFKMGVLDKQVDVVISIEATQDS